MQRDDGVTVTRESRVTPVTNSRDDGVTVHRESRLPVPTRPDPSLPNLLQAAAAFATLTCHRKNSTELPRTQDLLKLGTEPQTARAPRPGERWPILRDPDPERRINRWLWRAVAERDRWTCKICHEAEPSGNGWQVDHIVPWSAGGCDISTNLRLTCAGCNERRSNYFDPFARSMQPIIYPCASEDGEPSEVRAWCAEHSHWEYVSKSCAVDHELGLYIMRRQQFSQWLATELRAELDKLA